MKYYTAISILCAVSTASVTAFVSPKSSAVAPTAHKTGFCPTAAAPNQRCGSNYFTSLQAAQEDTVDVVIHDLLKISNFVYAFREVRAIVKENEGKTKKKKTGWFSSEEYKVAFDTPALILTQDGAQEKDKNQLFKYDITPDAIKLFMEKNRKWFYEPEGGGDWEFDEKVTEKTGPFVLEKAVEEATRDNLKIVDYDDEFTTNKGGLCYGVVVNLTRKWITVAFRGTVGLTDINTDRDFNLDYKSFFEGQEIMSGGKPGTHAGFTRYLVDPKMGDDDGRQCVERILACVNEEFKSNPDVVGKDFKLYVTGHSLGGGMGNLFAFRAAQLKAADHESVKHLPDKITALTFAAPVAGNYDYNKEFQALEKKGILRHIRVANKGDVVPTNEIFFPASLAIKGNTKLYTQNGVNLFLLPDEELIVDYRNTKSCKSQFGLKVLPNHMLTEYRRRVGLEVNKKFYQQTVEELYATAGDFTN